MHACDSVVKFILFLLVLPTIEIINMLSKKKKRNCVHNIVILSSSYLSYEIIG